jgi:hypothetical protein
MARIEVPLHRQFLACQTALAQTAQTILSSNNCSLGWSSEVLHIRNDQQIEQPALKLLLKTAG